MKMSRKEKKRGGKKGVVRPRPTGVTASAIMQLLEVWGLAELREWGGGRLMVGWGLTVPSTVQLDRKGEESCRKGGGGHEERDDKPDSGLFPFFPFPSFLTHGFPACHIMPLCYFSTSSQRKLI